MTSNSRFEILISVPWGPGDNEIPPSFDEHPSFSEMSADQMRNVRTPLRIRLDNQHRIHVMPEVRPLQPTTTNSHIYHFSDQGKFVDSTHIEIEVANYFHIYDYAVHPSGECFLLERIRRDLSEQTENRLRKIARDGTTLWKRVGLVSDEETDFHILKGNFTQLLADEDSWIYLPASDPECAIAQIDPVTGEVVAIHDCEMLGSKAFLREGRVYSVVYFPSENRKALARFDLAGGQTEFTLCDSELFGWLTFPLGVDRSANFYTFLQPAVGQIDFAEGLLRQQPLDNLVVQPSTQDIYLSYLSGLVAQSVIKVEIHRHDGTFESREINVPPRFAGVKDWKLIHADEQDRLFIFGGEEPGSAGTLLIFSASGNLEKELSPPGDLLSIESRLELFSYWQVDADGRVYLPFTDQQGFGVVRLTLG